MFRISTKETFSLKDFYSSALFVYKNDDNWVCPLNQEIENFFDANKNKLLKNGNFQRWVLYLENVPVGRIVAFWTEAKSKKSVPHSGGIGFFECIDSQEAANLLFDTAVEWLKNEGMQVADAITVPGENYNYWGVLTDGFMQQGFGMPYNPPYYKALFENYGFKTYFEQYSYHVDLTKEFPERHVSFAKHIIDSGDYEFRHLDFRESDKFVKDVTTVFNEVWSFFHADYVPVDEEGFKLMFEELKPVLNPEFIWFVYKSGHPVGMEICLPDINQVIKTFKGKLNLLNKLIFAFKIRRVNRARLFVFGVHPDYHRTGVMQALYLKMSESLKKAGVKELEMSWVGDYNPTVNRLYKHLGNSYQAKTHATYRFMIDKNIKFERFTN